MLNYLATDSISLYSYLQFPFMLINYVLVGGHYYTLNLFNVVSRRVLSYLPLFINDDLLKANCTVYSTLLCITEQFVTEDPPNKNNKI